MSNIYTEGYIGKQIFQRDDFRIYGFYPTEEYKEGLKINKYGNITIQGEMPELLEGSLYKITIRYERKNSYDNYIVERFHKDEQSLDETATINFLKAILTQRQVKTLMEHYPDIIDRVINNKEIDVNKLYGIKDKTMNVIRRKIVENFQLMDLVAEFYEYGMTFSMIKRLYKKFSSIELVRKNMQTNPYRCLCKINGVGFKKADDVIMKKYPEKLISKERADACMFYLLKKNEIDKGNSYMDLLKLYAEFKTLASECSEWFNKILKSDEIYIDQENKKVALKNTYLCEEKVSKIIKQLLLRQNKLDLNYKKYNEVDGIPLTDKQIDVLRKLCENNISILAGFGGSGKSFSTKALIEMLDDNKLNYILMSPTAKAAKVLKEYSGRDASTIHRGLGVSGDGFYYNEENKLPYDVVIIDEFSMVDIYLLRSLLEAIDIEKTRILFIGDPAQIPSVGVGNIAHDMINSGIIPTTMLTKVFRYGEGGLSYVATQTRNGENYLYDNEKIQVFGKRKDYIFINIKQEQLLDCVRTVYKKLCFKEKISSDDIIVLSAYNKGNYGTIKINAMIQGIINPAIPDKNEVYYTINKDKVILREGDKVMQTKNNYHATMVSDSGEISETIVINGDIGIITKIEKSKVFVMIDGKTILYDSGEWSQLSLAYSISIHKVQGSDAKYVIVATPKAHKYFLDRNLLYVADTRGKEKVYHIGTTDVVRSALRKSQNFTRDTFLKNLLTFR